MSILGGTNWLAFLFYGAITIVLSWFTSGCRFGDYVENNPSSAQSDQDSADPYTGYYATEPKSLTFFATTTKADEKVSAPLSLIPAEIAQYLTNPVALIVTKLSTGDAAITSPEILSKPKPSAMGITVHPDYSLTYSGHSSAAVLWDDPDCTTELDLEETGALVPSSTVASPPGNKYKLRGRLQLTLRLTTTLAGTCGPTLTFFANCYQDYTQCGGTTDSDNHLIQKGISSVFGPLILSQAVSVEDLPLLTAYAYEVSYQ